MLNGVFPIRRNPIRRN